MRNLFVTVVLALKLSVSFGLDYVADRSEREAVFDLERGFTAHFRNWLDTNGYMNYNFAREGNDGFDFDGEYGGKENDDEQITKQPVIFLTGDTDHGVGFIPKGGASTLFEYMRTKGYKKSELYVTSYGSGFTEDAMDQAHFPEFHRYLRSFVEAVLRYTGAEKIDVVGHSMGVSFGRQILKGGLLSAATNPINLGPSLADRVDTFVAISGANYGIEWCVWDFSIFCNSQNGYYPGWGEGPILLSQYLQNLNDNPIREADHIFAIYSVDDWLIGHTVYGEVTAMFPTVDDSVIYENYDHFQMRDNTYEDVYSLLTDHKVVRRA